MGVDVLTEIEIKRPRDEVSAFAADPSSATAWYKNIKAVEWETAPPAVVGSRVRFRAQFLGRTFGIHLRGSRDRGWHSLRDGYSPGPISDEDDLYMAGRGRGRD
jgi:hypothetical protein